MTALATDRNTPRIDGDLFDYPVLAAAKIFAGAIVVLDAAGWAKPAVTATGLVPVGRAEKLADNTGGANGAITVTARRGVFRYANSAAGDQITQAEIGDTCYLVDDQTVAKTDGTATRSAAGKVEHVDTVGVWVRIA